MEYQIIRSYSCVSRLSFINSLTFLAIRRVRAILVGDEFISICSAGVIQMFSISSDEGLFFLEGT